MKTVYVKFIAVIISLFGFACLCGCSQAVEAQNTNAESDVAVNFTEESAVAVNATEESVQKNGVSGQKAMETEEKETESVEEAATVTEEESAAAEEAAEEKTVVISLAGDCSLGKLSIHGYEGTFYEMYDLHGAEYFFKNVKSIFESDDMTLVNFEGVLTDSDEIVEKQYNIKGKPEYNQILTEADIEAVSFGNNHRIDYGQEGMENTIAAFNEVNVSYAYDDNLGIYETENGAVIGFISVNEVYDDTQVEVYLKEGIDKLKQQGVDLILACCHWGIETHHYPESYQTELGRKCIDWGADLVVGCHPHVLQGIDCYNGKYIIYSLGNFCFGGNKNPKDKNTMIVQAEVTVNEEGPVGEMQLKVIPCTISSVSDRNDYCPTVADGDKAKEIIRNLNVYSSEFEVFVAEDGTVQMVKDRNAQSEGAQMVKDRNAQSESAQTVK